MQEQVAVDREQLCCCSKLALYPSFLLDEASVSQLTTSPSTMISEYSTSLIVFVSSVLALGFAFYQYMLVNAIKLQSTATRDEENALLR